jgi:hypothetical protein
MACHLRRRRDEINSLAEGVACSIQRAGEAIAYKPEAPVVTLRISGAQSPALDNHQRKSFVHVNIVFDPGRGHRG